MNNYNTPKLHTLLTAALLVMATLTATAQNVARVHLKDGTTIDTPNGWTGNARITFWEHQPDTTHGFTYTYGDGHVAPYDVAAMLFDTSDHTYAAAYVYWEPTIPSNFRATHGLCLSTQPGVSLDHCEQSVETSQMTDGANNLTGHLAVIGDRFLGTNMSFTYNGYYRYAYLSAADSSRVGWMHLPLVKGQTYYYRTYAKSDNYISGGGQQGEPVVFYSDEKSFRVHNRMTESGLVPDFLFTAEIYDATRFDITYPSAEAWAAFGELHPRSDAVDERAIVRLWTEWLQTDDGRREAEATEGDTHTFDDGTLRLLRAVPEALHQWMAQREVVARRTGQITELGPMNGNDTLCTVTMVTDVAPEYELPGNSYMLIEPRVTTVNISATVDISEAHATGLAYRLRLTFAPETLYDADDETASTRRLPTLVRLTTGSTRLGEASYEVSGTEKTVIEIDDVRPGQTLTVETRVTSRQVRNGEYNRILRLSEVRLTPVAVD